MILFIIERIVLIYESESGISGLVYIYNIYKYINNKMKYTNINNSINKREKKKKRLNNNEI